jgi:hypothetical protein
MKNCGTLSQKLSCIDKWIRLHSFSVYFDKDDFAFESYDVIKDSALVSSNELTQSAALLPVKIQGIVIACQTTG